jgi:hypothetical protein
MPAGKGILNYTTVIDPTKTAGECFTMLARHGAAKVMITFDGKQEPNGLSFEIATQWGQKQYALPVNAAGTLAALEAGNRAGNVANRYVTQEQAVRTGWRVLKDWLEAQLAMIEAGVSVLDQVMMPWEAVADGRNMYEAVREAEQAALTAGSQ